MVVKELSTHLNKHFLEYTVLALFIGFLIGLALKPWIASHSALMKNLIMVFAILTIYPSMIQLRGEKLGEAAKKGKELLIALIFIFVLAPILAMIFAYLISDKHIALGYVASNVVPASSAAMGYVLLADGDLELATVLAVVSLFGSLVAIPGYLSFYASASSIIIPLDQIVTSVIYTLVLPFIAGQVTRWILIRYHEAHKTSSSANAWISQELKPYTGLATMTTMLVLVALLLANEAGLITKLPLIAIEILLLQTIMLALLIGLVTIGDRILKVDYEEHVAITYISATKNQSVAAAISVMALGPNSALAPSLIPAIQSIVAITYLRVLPSLNKWFTKRTSATAKTKK